MTADVNESFTLNINAVKGATAESGVNVRIWNDGDTSQADKTTDVQGEITPTVITGLENDYTASGSPSAQTDNTPINIRGLKWGLKVVDLSIGLTAPASQTLFMEDNNLLTETVEATVAAYTGTTYTHASDILVLGAGTIDTMDELYDDAQYEAVFGEQPAPPEVISSVDGQNFILEYEWQLNRSFNGQNKAIALALNQDVVLGTGGTLLDVSLTVTGTGEVRVTVANANLMENVTIVGDLVFDIPANATVDLTNVTVTGDVTNAQAGFTLTINKSGGSFTTSEPGTGAGLVNIVQSNTLTITGVPNGGILTIYDLDGVGESLGTTLQTTNPTTGADVLYVHAKDSDPILIQYVQTGFEEVNLSFTLLAQAQSVDISGLIEPETNL